MFIRGPGSVAAASIEGETAGEGLLVSQKPGVARVVVNRQSEREL